MRTIVALTAVAIALTLLMTGCTHVATVEPTQTAVQTKLVAPPSEATSAGHAKGEPSPTSPAPIVGSRADGMIADGEYDAEATFGQVRVLWSNDAESLYLAMEAPTTGWVSVGLDPETRMKGANYIIGAVVESEAKAWDAYGTAPVGASHPPDEELGGTNDIAAFAGVEEEGNTLFEIQIPLDSGDQYDKTLVPGQTYAIIVATGGSDEFNSRHTSRASGQITLNKGD